MTDKKLIPFDLKRAKAGDPVQTRDGRKARIVCFDYKNDPYPILALIYENEREIVHSFAVDGIYCIDKLNEKDLFMEPKINTFWINVFEHKSTKLLHISCTYESEEKATFAAKEAASFWNYLKTISFEVES